MELKVGDRIYQFYLGRVKEIYQIDRITKTLAVSGNIKFKLEYNHPEVITINSANTWEMSSYSLETPELKEQLFKQNAISKIQKAKLEDLSIEQLKEIIKILNS
jgi:hypothetical protein